MCLRASSAATQDLNCSCALSLALGGRKRTCGQHTSAYVSAAFVSIRQRMHREDRRKRTATNVRAVAAMPRLSASNDGPLFAGEKVLRGEGLLSEGEPTSEACRHFCFGLGLLLAAAAAEVERTCF